MGLPLVATSDAHYVRREDAGRPGCVAVHQHGQVSHRHESDADGRAISSFCAAPEEMYAAFVGLEDAVARSQQIADTVDLQLELGKRHFPSFAPPDAKTTAAYLRELCDAGLRERYAADPRRWQNNDPQSGQLERRGLPAARARAACDREARLLRLLPHRVGFRAVRDGAEDSVHGPRVGRGLARLLRAQDQPRVPAALRAAVRAVFGREPPRGARYRHRLLQGSPRRSHSIREGQIRRSERRANRHVRHAGRPGGDSRRRPHARACRSSASIKSWRWCPINAGHSRSPTP